MTKRVAFCMRGGVSTYRAKTVFNNGQCSKPDDIYKNKNYVNIDAIYKSIQLHIITPNPSYTFDFFLQCWNQDLEKKLVELYQPKLILFENNKDYQEEILKKCQEPSDFSGPSQLLAMKKSIELKETYEKSHHFTYDVVILYRYDVLLWKDIVLNKYDIKKNIYSSWYYLPETVGDFHFIMNSERASKFKLCYDWITDKNPYGELPHDFIYRFITYGLHEKIILDNIYPTIDQDVIRKIHPKRIQLLRKYGITFSDIKRSKNNTHIYFIDCTVYLVIICSILLSYRYQYSYASLGFYLSLFFTTLLTICFLLHYVIPFEYVIISIILITIFLFMYKS